MWLRALTESKKKVTLVRFTESQKFRYAHLNVSTRNWTSSLFICNFFCSECRLHTHYLTDKPVIRDCSSITFAVIWNEHCERFWTNPRIHTKINCFMFLRILAVTAILCILVSVIFNLWVFSSQMISRYLGMYTASC